MRLACKLLRQRALGAASPWSRYIRVLPAHVPAPLESFAWEDMTAIAYQPAREALDSAAWLLSEAYKQAAPEAHASSSEEDFRWAMSVRRRGGTGGRQGHT